MGRPIKKKYFGNTNIAATGEGVGGEGIASIVVTNGGTLYSQATTLSLSAPQIAGGQQATIDYSISGPGVISVTLTEGGSGYTSTPTLTVTTGTQVTQYVTNSGVTATNTLSVASVTGIAVGMRIYGGMNGGRVTAVDPVLNRVTSSENNMGTWSNANNLRFYDEGGAFAKTITMTSSRQNGIKFNSYIPAAAGGTAAVAGGDIVKQEGSHAYLVKNSEGTGICRLVTTSALSAGQMNLVATDANGSTYYVKKLTAHKAVLVQSTASGSFLVADNGVSAWTLGSAASGVVSIANQ